MKPKRIWGTLDSFFETGPILGRRVANTGFLSGLLRADPFDEYHFFLGDQELRDSLHEILTTRYPGTDPNKFKLMDRRELIRAIRETPYHCFHQSDCIVHPPHLARVRNRWSQRIFPITGTTHSLSYSNYPSRFLAHLWPSACTRDCIVATSNPGMKAVENFFSTLRRTLNLDSDSFPAPSLRRIPLGIDPNELKPWSPDAQAQAQTRLNLEPGRVRILVFGRIAHYSKMDVLPLLRAFQRLFQDGLDRSRVSLILAGWIEDDDDFADTLTELASNIGLDIRVFARPNQEQKQDLFAASDVFASISDNPQETFGLTMLEAGAAGLPVLCSDYDGYKDLIVHNETGLRVPTLGPASTPDVDAFAPLLFDNQYHLLVAQQTAVRVPELAQDLRTLIESPELRRDMGKAGRKRVKNNYSWSEVIRQHVLLWDELNEMSVDRDSLTNHAHPLHLPFGEIFGHYTTQTLDQSLKLVRGRTGEAFYRQQDFPVIYPGLAERIDQDLLRKITYVARKPISANDLCERLLTMVPGLEREGAEFALLWCVKHDVLEIFDTEEHS